MSSSVQPWIVAVSLVLATASTGCMLAGHAVMAAAAQPAGTSPAYGAPPMTEAPAHGAPPATSARAHMCPMSVPGTQVSAADTPTGEALTFTTTPDQGAALREKVHAMADTHNRHHAGAHSGHAREGDTAGGMMGPGMMMGSGMTAGGMGHMHHAQMPPPSRAAVEDLPNGARIVVTPNDPADLAQLQSAVRMHANHMQHHGCGMMQHSPGEGVR